MKTLFLLVFAAVLCLPGGAQDSPEPKTLVATLSRESLARGQAYEMLGELCAKAPKRLSGSDDAVRAITWAKAKMMELGLDNVRLEPCRVPVWRRGTVARFQSVESGEREPLTYPILALGGSIATPENGIEAEIIEVFTLGQVRALGETARGRIVFFNQPMDPGIYQTFEAYGGAVSNRSRGAAEAAKVGAVAVIVRSMSTSIHDRPHTGAMNYEEGGTKIPAAAISTLGAERLAKVLKDDPKRRFRLTLDCHSLPDQDSFNVVGEWRGRTNPEEIVVVGGHLDSWDVAEGAHDDGAGCAQSIEVLRLFKVLNLRPRRTVRCVLFMNEENGLAGGKAYYEAHLKDMDKHVAALESDRGGFVPRGFTTTAAGAGLDILRGYARFLDDIGAGLMLPGGGGADISPMRASGVPLLGFYPDPQRYFDVHHSSADVFANVHERELELGAAVFAAMTFMIADAEKPLPRTK